MKKLLNFVFFVAIAFMLACCGKSEPRTVAEKSLDCIIKQDYRGCLEYVYVPADKQEEKEALINLIEAMMKSTKGKTPSRIRHPRATSLSLNRSTTLKVLPRRSSTSNTPTERRSRRA